jgi:predicted PurR-regulated permease PerM
MPSEAKHKLHSEVLFTIGILLLLAFVYFARDVLLLIYVSALFAVVLGPAFDGVRRIRLGSWQPGRGLAILLVLAVAFGLIVLFFTLFVPPIFRDLRNFASDLPSRISDLQLRLQDRLGDSALLDGLDVGTIERHASEGLGGAFGLFRGFFGGIFAFFSALILTAYFAMDGSAAFHWALSMIAEPQRSRLETTLLRAENLLRRWLAGQAGLMLLLGVSASAVFALLHLKYFLALGVLSGALNIIPVLGVIVSLILASLVAAFDSMPKLLGVLVFFLIYQQIEHAFLVPRIMRYSVKLPPLAIVVALTLGGAMAGILGALIAVPTAALVGVLAQEYLVKKPPEPLMAAAAENRRGSAL